MNVHTLFSEFRETYFVDDYFHGSLSSLYSFNNAKETDRKDENKQFILTTIRK